jgi:hypothetical protein
MHRMQRREGELLCAGVCFRHQVARARLEAANQARSARAKPSVRAPSVPVPERFPARFF